MLKFRTLGLAALLSLATGAACAQGASGGTTGTRACPGGDCAAPRDKGGSGGQAGALPLPGIGSPNAAPADLDLFALPYSGAAPSLHPTSFSALSGPARYLPFAGPAGPRNIPIPAFAEMQWNGAELPPASVVVDGTPVAGPSVPPRAIPEPNIYALLLAGLAAGAWASRRRKR